MIFITYPHRAIITLSHEYIVRQPLWVQYRVNEPRNYVGVQTGTYIVIKIYIQHAQHEGDQEEPFLRDCHNRK